MLLERAVASAQKYAGGNSPNIEALYITTRAYSGLGELATAATKKPGGPSCAYYDKAYRAWIQIKNPAKITPYGFSVSGWKMISPDVDGCHH